MASSRRAHAADKTANAASARDPDRSVRGHRDILPVGVEECSIAEFEVRRSPLRRPSRLVTIMTGRYVFVRAGIREERTMGLLDVLNGMQQGPRGPSNPSTQESGGMSPMTMAILGLLAWKAIKHLSGGQANESPTTAPPSGNAAAGTGGGTAGGLGDLLKGGLGGLLAGGAAGSVLSGGLNDLLKQFQQSGQGEAANSWVGTGPNKQISTGDLAKALGADQINALSTQSGLSRDELLGGLSRHLPQVVDHLTPDGRVPNEKELSGRI
jgi:uncharacterized protein YidB (DUF937 family)